MSWARNARNWLICQKYSRTVKSPKERWATAS